MAKTDTELNPPIGGRRTTDQAAPLLSVKIRPPWRSRGIIMRPRLDSFLDVLRHRLLTTVIAPPGFGKTTMALSWVDALAGDGGRIAWLSLGPEDNELERFLNYLEAAMAPVFDRPEEQASSALSATFSLPMETRLGWLLEELGTLADDVFLFIDDFHLVANPHIHLAMAFLLRNAPACLHLIVLSRKNLPLNLDHLRARDGIFEIGANALLFDVGETDQLLNKGEFTQPLHDEAPTLHTLTGGWIAALRAAVVTMRSHGNPQQYLRQLPATLRPISSLFTDLLEGLPPEMVDFLERVCVTERQCAGLAEALTGSPDGQAMLEQMERQHLFVDRQDDGASWFVFHPLFREFLEQRTRAKKNLELFELHRQASRWFASENLWTEAIHHALVAGDVAQALQWIETYAMVLVGDGDILTLLSWERQLSAHLVASPIRLRLAFSWALCLSMASERALELLLSVEAELETLHRSTEKNALQREIQALRSVLLAQKGDYEASGTLAAQYLSHPGGGQPWVPNAILNVIASTHLHTGRWEQLYVVPPLSIDPNVPRLRDRTSMVYRLCILGLAEYHQGNLEDAARYLNEGMALGAAIGARGKVLQALPAPTLALVRYEQGRLEEARLINTEHFDINRRVGPIDGLSGSYRMAARIARMQGKGVRARTLLDDAERVASARGWKQVQAIICMERIRFFLQDGRLPDADGCIARLDQLAESADHQAYEHKEFLRVALLAKAWRHLVDDSSENAIPLLESLLATAREQRKRLQEINIGTTLALAFFSTGRHADVLPLFLRLCHQAQAIGSVRAILDQPVPTEDLLNFAITQARNTKEPPKVIAFLETLVRVQNDFGANMETGDLSPREHRILNLLSQGLSNKEIGRNLGVTAETVKSHLKKIYAKLGVQNRAQAAARLN